VPAAAIDLRLHTVRYDRFPSRVGRESARHPPSSQAAEVSICQRWKALPSLSLQAANQPMAGTGIFSSASPPSSLIFARAASISSTA